MQILIADDKPQIRRVLRKLIEEHEGWNVCAEAENGVEAVAQAQQSKPDLILLDLAMPEMNGFDAARQISRLLPQVPIFMVTLYGTSEVEAEARKCGVQRVISKSERNKVVQAIEAAFPHGRPSNEGPNAQNGPSNWKN